MVWQSSVSTPIVFYEINIMMMHEQRIIRKMRDRYRWSHQADLAGQLTLQAYDEVTLIVRRVWSE